MNIANAYTGVPTLPDVKVKSFQEILEDKFFLPKLEVQIATIRHRQQETERYLDRVIKGVHKHGLLSGPPGLGKSYSIYNAFERHNLKDDNDYKIVNGITPFQLFQLLYKFRHPGKFIVLDDTDTLFYNPKGLELLKAACDTDEHKITWFSASTPVINGMPVKEFVFKGSIIVGSNLLNISGRGGRRDQQVTAFLSRLDPFKMDWANREEQFAQIYNLVVNEKYMDPKLPTPLTEIQQQELMSFIFNNIDKFRPENWNLRMPLSLSKMMLHDPVGWQDSATIMYIKGV